MREEVAEVYGRVAADPDQEFHFHRGPAYAADFLGYDREELASLPAESTRSFAGVGNPHLLEAIEEGETVVDVGCGAGTDLLLAARRVGPAGRAIGVDMVSAMLARARRGAEALGLANVEFRRGDAESLPLEDGSADAILSNGVYSLTTDKARAFAEVFRVLKPGGRLLLADIAVSEELSEDVRNNIDLWTS